MGTSRLADTTSHIPLSPQSFVDLASLCGDAPKYVIDLGFGRCIQNDHALGSRLEVAKIFSFGEGAYLVMMILRRISRYHPYDRIRRLVLKFDTMPLRIRERHALPRVECEVDDEPPSRDDQAQY